MSATMASIHDDLVSLEQRLAALGVDVSRPTPRPAARPEPVQQQLPAAPTFKTGTPAPEAPRQTGYASQRQIDLIQRLARERGVTHTEGGKLIADLSTSTPGLDNRRVTQVLDFIRIHPVRKQVRRNRRTQDCEDCGHPVVADQGILTNENGSWVVRHDSSIHGCEKFADPVRAETDRVCDTYEPPVPEYIDLSGFPEGNYADPTSEGSLKVEIRRGGEGFEEFTYVSDAAVYGWHSEYGVQVPGSPYRGGIQEHLRAIVADRIGAAARYGQLTSTCGMCGRPLEDGKPNGSDGLSSLERGIGPVCFKKLSA